MNEAQRKSYMLYDPETGMRASMQSWPTVEYAEWQRQQWLDRCDKGGRPDIPREFLERLEVAVSVHP